MTKAEMATAEPEWYQVEERTPRDGWQPQRGPTWPSLEDAARWAARCRTSLPAARVVRVSDGEVVG